MSIISDNSFKSIAMKRFAHVSKSAEKLCSGTRVFRRLENFPRTSIFFRGD